VKSLIEKTLGDVAEPNSFYDKSQNLRNDATGKLESKSVLGLPCQTPHTIKSPLHDSGEEHDSAFLSSKGKRSSKIIYILTNKSQAGHINPRHEILEHLPKKGQNWHDFPGRGRVQF